MGFGDWDGIMTNGMGQMGFGMGFRWDGIWDSPIPINMGGKYILGLPDAKMNTYCIFHSPNCSIRSGIISKSNIEF